MKGKGGQTIDKVFKHDLEWLKSFKPDVIVLKLGKNDFSRQSREVVGSMIPSKDDLACFLRDDIHVSVMCVCQVIDHHVPYSAEADKAFNAKAAIMCLGFLSQKRVYSFGVIENFLRPEFTVNRWGSL